jgi:hypothetical protein
VQVIVSDFIHCVDHNLRNPDFLDFLGPLCVVVIDCHLQVRYFICDVKLLPLVDVFELDLALLCALIAYVRLNKVLYQFNRVLGEKVFGRLAGSDCR